VRLNDFGAQKKIISFHFLYLHGFSLGGSEIASLLACHCHANTLSQW
jgi:hypothetical protein